MKKELPIIIGLLAGIAIIVSTLFTGPAWLPTMKNSLNKWNQIAQAWMIGLGVVNLTIIHSRRVSGKSEGWGYSIWLIICMFGMIIFGMFIAKSANNEGWRFMYNQIIAPMNATVYSTLVFYIGSAAYRSFRIRNKEATVLLIAAVIMMLGRVPLGQAIFGEWITKLADWILNYPNSAGMRGITIGATLGAVATALRIMVGIERGHLGGTGGE